MAHFLQTTGDMLPVSLKLRLEEQQKQAIEHYNVMETRLNPRIPPNGEVDEEVMNELMLTQTLGWNKAKNDN